MSQPATELMKLLALRDAGELTEAEYAAAKHRILTPGFEAWDRPRRSIVSRMLGDLAGWFVAVIVMVLVLIGSVAALALTDAGMIALLAIVIAGVVVLGVLSFLTS